MEELRSQIVFEAMADCKSIKAYEEIEDTIDYLSRKLYEVNAGEKDKEDIEREIEFLKAGKAIVFEDLHGVCNEPG